ncbi:MAG: xanthine dehydrogenase family protein subunit M [Polyangiaceae bacterium]
MIPAQFDYHKPRTLDEAITLLREMGGAAKVLAGGQSLIPAMRFRLAQPEVLIDINGLTQLEYVEERGNYLAIGALTREHSLEDNALIKERYPLLLDTAKVIADPIVRNRATVGGNLAHADPANDHPATMLAYGAEVVAKGPVGERVIPIDSFFTGLFENALKAGEILIEVRIPRPAPRSGGAYLKLERKVGDYAVAAVAVQLTLDGEVVKSARIGLTNVSSTPMRAKKAEAELIGKPLLDAVLEAAGRAAALECEPSSDLRGSEAYKRDMTRVLLKRAVRTAADRAKGART